MTREDALALIHECFGRDFLEVVARSYRVRADTHDAAIGDNAMTFGTNVRFTVERFVEEAIGGTSGVSITRPLGSFQVGFLGQIFHFYKYGMDKTDDIEQLSFDDSATKANLIADNQLALPGIPRLRHLVIAHCGNPEQGLVEVYVGAPHTLGGHRSPWAWKHQLYSLHEQLSFDLSAPSLFAKPMRGAPET